MPLVDLTQPFSDGMFSLSTLPRITVERVKSIPKNGFNVTCLHCAVHSGTHIDAPNHFIADGCDAAEIPLDNVCGAAVCLDVPCEPRHEITIGDLERANKQAEIQRGDIVLVHTGFGKFFTADPQRYHHHPFLSPDAAEWFVGRGVKMVAFDIPTPDRPVELRPAGYDFPAHKILLGKNVLIAEHLANLEKVAGKRFRSFAFPLPIETADGSPVRFVAEL